MLTLLGKAGVVDDPGLDRTVPLHLGHHHLANLGQHLLVRPLSLTDEMQQRLMLRRRAMRRRDRRHRLHALALIWGTTISRTLASTLSSDHFPSPMKCTKTRPRRSQRGCRPIY